MSCTAQAGPAVTAAWRRYRLTEQEAWTVYQAASKSSYERLQKLQGDSYDRCERLALASMDRFRRQLSAWYAAENGTGTPLEDDAATDPDTAFDDHQARVAQAVRVRESEIADMRADYRASCNAAVNVYQRKLIQARHQWLDACRGGSGRHDVAC